MMGFVVRTPGFGKVQGDDDRVMLPVVDEVPGDIENRDLCPMVPRNIPWYTREVKQCQSCGMPLETKRAGDCRGTEADGSRSNTWCSLCYSDGRFTNPDCTLQEMIELVDRVLKRQGAWFVMRRLAKRQIPTLARWR